MKTYDSSRNPDDTQRMQGHAFKHQNVQQIDKIEDMSEWLCKSIVKWLGAYMFILFFAFIHFFPILFSRWKSSTEFRELKLSFSTLILVNGLASRSLWCFSHMIWREYRVFDTCEAYIIHVFHSLLLNSRTYICLGRVQLPQYVSHMHVRRLVSLSVWMAEYTTIYVTTQSAHTHAHSSVWVRVSVYTLNVIELYRVSGINSLFSFCIRSWALWCEDIDRIMESCVCVCLA